MFDFFGYRRQFAGERIKNALLQTMLQLRVKESERDADLMARLADRIIALRAAHEEIVRSTKKNSIAWEISQAVLQSYPDETKAGDADV